MQQFMTIDGIDSQKIHSISNRHQQRQHSIMLSSTSLRPFRKNFLKPSMRELITGKKHHNQLRVQKTSKMRRWPHRQRPMQFSRRRIWNLPRSRVIPPQINLHQREMLEKTRTELITSNCNCQESLLRQMDLPIFYLTFKNWEQSITSSQWRKEMSKPWKRNFTTWKLRFQNLRLLPTQKMNIEKSFQDNSMKIWLFD